MEKDIFKLFGVFVDSWFEAALLVFFLDVNVVAVVALNTQTLVRTDITNPKNTLIFLLFLYSICHDDKGTLIQANMNLKRYLAAY